MKINIISNSMQGAKAKQQATREIRRLPRVGISKSNNNQCQSDSRPASFRAWESVPGPRLPCTVSVHQLLSAGVAASASGGEAHRRGPLASGPVAQAATAPGLAASPGGGRAHLARPVPSRRDAEWRFRCAPRGRLLRWRRGPPPHLVAAGATCRLPHLPPLVRGSFLTFLSADSPF